MAEKLRAVLTDYEYESLANEERELKAIGADFIPCQCRSEEEIINAVREADGLLVQYGQITRRVMEEMERCRVIVRYGVGVDSIDLQAATDHKIMVCNVPAYGLEDVADHAMALLLSSIRKVVFLNNMVKNSHWDYKEAVPLYRIKGKKLGLLAFGNIARLVAERARAFGMDILVCDPFLSEDVASSYGVTMCSFDELLAESDYISIHCPLIESTRHTFNLEAFKKMKTSAIIINTARGPIIEEKALVEALKAGYIAGAGLDVTEEEPVARDSELLTLDNAIITPHAAWYSVESQESLQYQAAQEIARVLSGKQPFNLVNKEVLERL